MAETLTFDVLARASGAEDVKKVGKAIDDVGKSADDLGKKNAGGFFSKLTDGAKSAASSVGSAFSGGLVEKTKDTGSKLKASILGGLGDLGSVGKKAGSTLVSGISGALEAVGPGGAAVGAGILGAVALAAPIAGGILGGALVAGVAAAGIGVGVSQALNDPQVGSKAAELGTMLSDTLKESTASFVPATLDGIDRLKDRLATIGDDAKRIFSNLSPSVGPLADKIGTAIQSITKGIADLSQAAGPVLDAIGNGLEMIGKVVKTEFGDMKDQGAAAGVAIQLLFDGIGTGLTIVLNAIDGLLTALGWLAEKGLLGDRFKESYKGWQDQLDQTKTSLEGVGTAAEQNEDQLAKQQIQTDLLTGSFMEAVNAVNGLKGAFDTLNGASLSATQSEIAYQAALDSLTASIQKNGTSLDLTTKAGRDNTTALTQAITTAQQYASANNLSAAEVEQLRANIIKQAEAAGLDSGKVQALTADLFKIPGEVNPKINILGYDEAKRQVAEIDASLRGLPKEVQTKIITQHLDVYNAVGAGSTNAAENRARGYGGIDLKMALGGAITSHFVRSPTVLYGERGDEAYVAKDAPRARSRAIVDQVAEKWLGGRVTWDDDTSRGAPRRRGSDAGLLAEVRQLRRAIQEMQRRPVTALSREGRNAQMIFRTG